LKEGERERDWRRKERRTEGWQGRRKTGWQEG
jgi:hypothetical protein